MYRKIVQFDTLDDVIEYLCGEYLGCEVCPLKDEEDRCVAVPYREATLEREKIVNKAYLEKWLFRRGWEKVEDAQEES